jgi:hypothetical protein
VLVDLTSHVCTVVLFGDAGMPAARAARVDPLVALRHE